MKCAICHDYDTYKVFFTSTGKFVRYCTKHGEVYIRLQMKYPDRYKVYSTSELTRYINRVKKKVNQIIAMEKIRNANKTKAKP